MYNNLVFHLYTYSCQFMKSRQGTSTPKFVRRTSQSPWDLSRATCTIEGDGQSHTGTGIEFKLNSQHKYFTINQQKSPIKCVRANAERLNTSLDGVTISRKLDVFGQERDRVQQVKVSGQCSNAENKQEIYDIYLPIESVSTVDSIRTARKKPAQNQELGMATKRKQQFELPKIDIRRILEQNQFLLRSEQSKKAEIDRLNQELQNTRMHNFELQRELGKLIDIVEDLEHGLKMNRSANDELRKSLQNSELKKIRLDGKVNQLTLLLAKLQFDVKCQKEENQQLNRNIKLKQKEIADFKSQNTNIQNSIRQTSARVVRSVSIQQSNYFPENSRVYTIKADNPPPVQKYSRPIQTQNCKLEVALKQNEMMMMGLKNKDKTIKAMQKQIHNLNKKVKVLDQITSKLQETEKLIEELNKQILVTAACKLANKYKYF